ncbi:MAG: hypothetical protein KAF91_18605 [Nostoc sp. TH1S01]|nr:hypothetical protein [Nostoc sp. TH1S01]
MENNGICSVEASFELVFNTDVRITEIDDELTNLSKEQVAGLFKNKKKKRQLEITLQKLVKKLFYPYILQADFYV